MRRKLGLVMFLTLVFWGLLYGKQSLAASSNLSEVQTESGATILTAEGVTVDKIEPGVFVLENKQANCIESPANCNMDKFEIQIPGITNHIFGSGMINAVNQAELDDFLDEHFSFGHCESVGGGRTLSGWLSGACRMRTPVFVLPEKNMLIAYFQPYPKVVRLSRKNEFGCPLNNNCLVMKLEKVDNLTKTAPFVVIKKANMDEVFKAYKKVRDMYGYTDKQPTYSAFGANWETFAELGCYTNKQTVLDTVDKFLAYGKLGTVTVGSGYWLGQTPGCGSTTDETVGKMVTTDALVVNEEKWGGLTGINDYYKILKNKGIVPIIGMRHRVSPGVDMDESNVSRIINLFGQIGINGNLFISSGSNASRWLFLNDDPDVFYMLNNTIPVIDGWLRLISENYGNFGGIKHDDMIVHDQTGFTGNNVAINLPDNYYNNILDRYTNKYGKDFVILTRDTWLANKGDAIVPDWLGEYVSGFEFPSNMSVYPVKYQFDNAITTAMSGYSTIQSYVYNNSEPGANKTSFLRSTQLAVFQGVTMFSEGFWRAEDAEIESTLKYFLILRNRLQQYAYDQAMESYKTGMLKSLRPLFFDYPNDWKIYEQYSQLNTPSDSYNPRNEFMFGDALLVRPVFADASTVSIYLPQGVWKPLLKKSDQYNGGTTINYTLGSESSGLLDYPVFLKEKRILVIGNYPSNDKLQAYVYFASPGQTAIYNMYSKDGTKIYRLQAEQTDSGTVLKNLDNNQSVSMQLDSGGKNIMTANDISSILGIDCTPGSGDTDGDGVDINDLIEWYKEYKSGEVGVADFNCDEKVDMNDLIVWYSGYRNQ